KKAMLSCSRLAAYTNLPSAEIITSEVKFVPTNPFGRVELPSRLVSFPLAESKSNSTSVEPSSCSEYSHRPFGWKAKCRGPSPGGSGADGGLAGVSLPVAASNFQIRI